MTEKLRADIVQTLLIIEQELHRLDAWEGVPPAPERLASAIPFCHDTLEFTQWVQWIFIPRFRAILEGNHPLPAASAIAPIAEDALLRIAGDTDALLAAFREIDSLITKQEQAP